MVVLSLVYEKGKEKEYLKDSKVGLQAADNVYQWNIIDGILENNDTQPLYIINSVPVGCFPKADKRIRYKGRYCVYGNATLKNVGFINLPIIKAINRFFAYLWIINKYIAEDKRLVVYGLYLPQLFALKMIELVFPGKVETTLFIDDLPGEYGLLPNNRMKKSIKLFFDKQILRILDDGSTINHFVFLTDAMRDVVKLDGRTYTIIEGVANACKVKDIQERGDNKTVLYYAGTLSSAYGIKTLLKAFELVKEQDFELWICGDGDARDEVIRAASRDNRIKYYGFVDKKTADVLKEQADILINPRTNEGNYTKYSFPSKTIEYMLSAKPVIMHKLDGIPQEYDEFLIYFDDKTPEAIAEKILEVALTDRKRYVDNATKGKEWILRTKNSKSQMKRMLQLFDDGKGYDDRK